MSAGAEIIMFWSNRDNIVESPTIFVLMFLHVFIFAIRKYWIGFYNPSLAVPILDVKF